MYRVILFTIAVGLLIAFLYVMHIWNQTSENGSARDSRTLHQLTLLRRIVVAGFGLCLFAMAAMTFMVLGQEYLFLRWASVGISVSRPAAHTPYYVLMFELGGLSVMHFALLLLVRAVHKDVMRTTGIDHPQDKKTKEYKEDMK